MRVPSIRNFREAVDAIPDPVASIMVKTIYLTAARVSEVTTKTAPWDLLHRKTKPYGQFMSYRMETWKWKEGDQEETEEVFLITEAVAKRRAKKNSKEEDNLIYKTIALPTHRFYEPWTKDLEKYFNKNNRRLSFDLTRQRVWQLVKENLSILDPAIQTQSLRQYRISHLQEYGFSLNDLILYSGWNYRRSFKMLGIPKEKLIYLHTAWQEYFPKLLKPIRDLLYS